MLWGYKYGKTYELTYGTLLINKLAIPDEWVNPPVLPIHLVWVRDAFNKLSTCRQSGFGLTPIPWTAVMEYARYLELDEYETDRFEYLISSLDDAVIRHYSEKDKKPKKKDEDKGGKK